MCILVIVIIISHNTQASPLILYSLKCKQRDWAVEKQTARDEAVEIQTVNVMGTVKKQTV